MPPCGLAKRHPRFRRDNPPPRTIAPESADGNSWRSWLSALPSGKMNFREFVTGEVCRIPLLGTSVNIPDF